MQTALYLMYENFSLGSISPSKSSVIINNNIRFLNVMICFPRGQKSRRRVSILAGAIVSDYQDRVGNRESLLDAQANLLDHFFFLACQVLRVNYRCNNQRQRKTLTSSSDYSNRRLYITSSCKPPRTLKTLAEMKGCTD